MLFQCNHLTNIFLYKKLTCSWNRATQESGVSASHVLTFLERKYKVNRVLETLPRSRISRFYILLETLGDLLVFLWLKTIKKDSDFFSYNSLTWGGSNLEYKHSLLLKQGQCLSWIFPQEEYKTTKWVFSWARKVLILPLLPPFTLKNTSLLKHAWINWFEVSANWE